MIKSDRFVICMLNPHIVQCIAVQVSMKNQHRLRGCVYKYVLNKIVYISRISYSAATQSFLILKSPNTSERLRNVLTIFNWMVAQYILLCVYAPLLLQSYI